MMFEPGDIFLAATDVDDRNVDLRNHSGPGRILHHDAALRLRGELRTGHVGLVIGLGYDRRHRELLAADPSAHVVSRFAADGSLLEPLPFMPRARIGSVQFLPDGRFCAGMTLAADGQTLIYVSETGRRVMRYDLAARRQLDDLLVLGADDPRGTYGLACTPDGRVLMATGNGAAMFAADGSQLKTYDIPERRGWSRLQLSQDPTRFWLSNFFEGILQQRDVETGALLREHDIGRKFSLCGLAEVPT